MNLTSEGKDTARNIVKLWDEKKIPRSFQLRAYWERDASGKNITKYRSDFPEFIFSIDCLEELGEARLIRFIKIFEQPMTFKGWKVTLLQDLRDAVESNFRIQNEQRVKMKYRHLSVEAKALASKLVEHKVAGKIGMSLDFRLLRGGDTIMSVMPLDLKNDIHITPEELRYFDELASMGLLATSGFGETLTIKLQPSLFDAVENDFTDIDYSLPPTHTQINIQSPILGPVGFNTGSGSFQQTQNLQISFPELRNLLVDLGLDSPELSSLIDEVERHPDDKNRVQLALELLNKGISRLSDYGGAVAALQLAIQFISGLKI